MQTIKTLLLAVASFYSITTLAAPAPDAKPKDGCVVPAIAFESLPKPFTMTALIGDKSYGYGQDTWPVQVFPRFPSKGVTSKPVISRKKIALPFFKLIEGKLVYEGFNAEFPPVILIFPPPLQSFVWGGPNQGRTVAKFFAGYGCDAKGNQILELFDTLPNSEFVVKKVAESEQIFVRPENFAGQSTVIRLQINGGQ